MHWAGPDLLAFLAHAATHERAVVYASARPAILDLAPVPEGSTTAQALAASLDLARDADLLPQVHDMAERLLCTDPAVADPHQQVAARFTAAPMQHAVAGKALPAQLAVQRLQLQYRGPVLVRTRGLDARRTAVADGHRPLAAELDLLDVFTDLAELSRNRPAGEEDGGAGEGSGARADPGIPLRVDG